MANGSDANVSAAAVSEPVRRQNTTPMLLGVLIALAVVAVIVWLKRPVPENYQPPPVPPKTVAQVESEMAKIKADKSLPENQKQRMLGYLQADMKIAKEWEGKKFPAK